MSLLLPFGRVFVLLLLSWLFAELVTSSFPTSHYGSAVPTGHRRTAMSAVTHSAADRRSSGAAVADNAAVDLRCPPCDRIHCWPRRPSRLRCPGGIVRDICDCCPVCARLEGQPCGGWRNYLGRCDAGLHCSSTVDEDDRNAGRMPSKAFTKEQPTVSKDKLKASNDVWKPEGRCQRGQEMSDSPQPSVQCFPKCTPEFCQQGIKQLCSAVDNAERHQSCQSECQHTSCSACRFRRTSADCSETVRCSSSTDLDCLRRFGRCIRRQKCDARVGFPCRSINDFQTLLEEQDVKFVCVVPECATP